MIDWRDDYAGEHGWYGDRPERPAVVTEDKEARVTYRNQAGEKFRVIVRQKPNPIGFTARLPRGRSC